MLNQAKTGVQPATPRRTTPELGTEKYGTYTFPIEKVRDLVGYQPLLLAELAGKATA